MQQPEGFTRKGSENMVCKLKKIICLKQGGNAWNKKLNQALIELNFQCSDVDHSLYILRKDTNIVFLIACGRPSIVFKRPKPKTVNYQKAGKETQDKKPSPVSKILAINVRRDRRNKEIFLNQSDYIENILKYVSVWKIAIQSRLHWTSTRS